MTIWWLVGASGLVLAIAGLNIIAIRALTTSTPTHAADAKTAADYELQQW